MTKVSLTPFYFPFLSVRSTHCSDFFLSYVSLLEATINASNRDKLIDFKSFFLRSSRSHAYVPQPAQLFLRPWITGFHCKCLDIFNLSAIRRNNKLPKLCRDRKTAKRIGDNILRPTFSVLFVSTPFFLENGVP